MQSGKLVGITLALTAALATPHPRAESGDLAAAESRLEALISGQNRADAILRGQRVHARVCAACHGPEGRGDGPGAAELVPWPRDFKAGKFRSRSTESGQPPRRSDIESVVRLGRAGTAMPAFGGLLSESEIGDVVTFLFSLRPRGLPDREPEALAIPEFPPPTAEHLSDGRALYLSLGCWKCHGTDGSGRGPSAGKLRSDEGQRIRPRDFRYEPFRGGRKPETVARAALSGLIGTPMPSHAEIMVVPRESIDAVVESLPAEVRPELEGFRRRAPSAAEVAALDDGEWQRLRDRNLVSLAYYVLSLSRRNGLAYHLFRQEPEMEGRNP